MYGSVYTWSSYIIGPIAQTLTAMAGCLHRTLSIWRSALFLRSFPSGLSSLCCQSVSGISLYSQFIPGVFSHNIKPQALSSLLKFLVIYLQPFDLVTHNA